MYQKNNSKSKNEQNSSFKLSNQAIDLLSLLLKKDPEERIQADQLLYHPFFSSYNFEDFCNKKIESPLMRYIKEIKLSKFFIDDEKCKIKDKGKYSK